MERRKDASGMMAASILRLTSCFKITQASMRKKNIAMLFGMSFLPNQGRYQRSFNEARSLARAGHNVVVLAWDRDLKSPEQEMLDGVRVERLRVPAGFQAGPLKTFPRLLKFYRKALSRLKEMDADVVHCFNLDPVVPALLAARLRKKPFVLDLCEPNYYGNWKPAYRPLHAVVSFLEKAVSRRADYLFVHNRYQVEKFKSYGVTRLEQIGSYPNRPSIAENPCVSDRTDDAVIGRIGSIYEDNGVEELVAAFTVLLKEFPRLRLLLAGKVAPRYHGTFEALIAPIRDRVDATGAFSFSDMPALYSRIDVSVMLYIRNEHFINVTPTKFFDSLASGVPLVTSDIGGLREIIEQHHCGIVVDETDCASICGGLKRLIQDPALRKTLAENGLRLAKETYNWEAQEQRFIEIYNSL
jgi:glycosyltransferase involved in cell wall biosynthesis